MLKTENSYSMFVKKLYIGESMMSSLIFSLHPDFLAPLPIHNCSILFLIIMKDKEPKVFTSVKTKSAMDFLKNNTLQVIVFNYYSHLIHFTMSNLLFKVVILFLECTLCLKNIHLTKQRECKFVID